MIKVGVVGATGYTGEEIVNCLLRHTGVKVAALAALVDKSVKFHELFPKFAGRIDIFCKNLDAEEIAAECDIVFLALPHTVSNKFAPLFLKKGVKVIDLSADYRLPEDIYRQWYGDNVNDKAGLKEAVYGLPELNREKIAEARLIANPGCYPTSVILGLLPITSILSKGKISPIVDSKSGVTGAGRKAAIPLSFGEVDGSLKCYKANEHQHMPEMEYILSAASGENIKINFTPHLVPLRRGILSTIYVKSADLPSEEDILSMFRTFYKDEPFVRVREEGRLPEIQDVAGTNFCDIGIKVAGGMLVIVSVIDNLLKGASGQAVQNMNIMCGFDEKQGLV